jgi:thiamine-phosphate diphosphorylase
MSFTKEEIRKAMKLYAISDRHRLKEDQKLIDVVEEILKAGVTFLQIREKDLDKESFLEEAIEMRKLAGDYKVPFVVNDSIEIAQKVDADGVHLGQSDLVDRDIKEIIGKDKILGISANSVETAIDAQKRGADYIGVGAMFSTSTKGDAKTIPMETLKEIRKAVDIPIVAIGGISLSNLKELEGTGIDGISVISAIFGADDPAKATKELLKEVEEVINE